MQTKWNQFLYVMKFMLRSIYRHKFTSFVNIVCMSLGILIAAIFICQANDAYYDYKRNEEFYNKTEVYSLIPEYYENTGRIEKKDYPDIQNKFKEIKDIVCVNRINENYIQSKNQFITGLNVYTMSKNMDSLLKIEDYIQGEWLDHNEDCLIGDKVQKNIIFN